MTQSNHRPHSNHERADLRVPTPDVLGLTEHAALQAAVTRANPNPNAELMTDALAWARSVRLHALLLDRVLAGDVDILVSPDDGDMTFRPRSATNIIPFGPASRAMRPRRTGV